MALRIECLHIEARYWAKPTAADWLPDGVKRLPDSRSQTLPSLRGSLFVTNAPFKTQHAMTYPSIGTGNDVWNVFNHYSPTKTEASAAPAKQYESLSIVPKRPARTGEQPAAAIVVSLKK